MPFHLGKFWGSHNNLDGIYLKKHLKEVHYFFPNPPPKLSNPPWRPAGFHIRPAGFLSSSELLESRGSTGSRTSSLIRTSSTIFRIFSPRLPPEKLYLRKGFRKCTHKIDNSGSYPAITGKGHHSSSNLTKGQKESQMVPKVQFA